MRWWNKVIIPLMVILLASGCTEIVDSFQNNEKATLMAEESTQTLQGIPAMDEGVPDFYEGDCENEIMHEQIYLTDDNYIYICYGKCILKVDRETLDNEEIYKIPNKRSQYDCEINGGILLKDKIYFIESGEGYRADTQRIGQIYTLSVINTDGSGYQKIEQISNERMKNLVFIDGIIYFTRTMVEKELEGYATKADGTLWGDEIVTKPIKFIEDYYEIYSYTNKTYLLTSIESLHQFGYYLLRNKEHELCVVEQNTGEERLFSETLRACFLEGWNNNFFLFYDDKSYRMYLVDVQTLEISSSIDLSSYKEGNIDIIFIDDRYVYWTREISVDERRVNRFERLDLQDGSVEELFVQAFGICSVIDDNIYYVIERDYKLYHARRNINHPKTEEQLLGEAFYDTGISEIGTLESFKEVIYSNTNPQVELGEIYLERLIVDAQFKGADKINDQLEEEQQTKIERGRELAALVEEWNLEGEDESSYSSEVSQIYYSDENYFSFVQHDYEREGGRPRPLTAWISYTFDLNSGKRLTLKDVIGNSEEELKQLTQYYFSLMYETGFYWEDSMERVYNETTFESPFYLCDEGLVIYYEHGALTVYMAGFQEILIPYEELDMKIELKHVN